MNKEISDKFREQNLKSIVGRHGLKNPRELADKAIQHYEDWFQIQNEIEAMQWINVNMVNRGKTIMEYIRAIVEYKIKN
ncbi:MAG: hypothetical protein ABIJ05_04975 [Patescibacteria group bacterium]